MDASMQGTSSVWVSLSAALLVPAAHAMSVAPSLSLEEFVQEVNAAIHRCVADT